MIKKIALIVIIATGIYSCTTVPISGRKQLNMLPESQMMSMSLTQYQSFLKENPPVSANVENTKMVKRVGLRISHAVEKYMKANNMSNRIKGYKWEFNLIDENTVNAWCMPGGKVVVYTGILPVTKTEEGLAVVMGHEIAHAIARHGNERMSQGMLSQGITTGLAVALREKPQATQMLFLGAIGIGSQVGMLAFGRNQESEADKLGMVFMAMAGYEPKEAIPFWERMKAVGGAGGTPEFLRTHPSHDIRIDRIKEWLPNAESYYEKAP
ncbi:MAG: M48 family metallopeptidase [Flavobacteriales bacterium]|nr:M48 family metallopeptidase [Flavobacteriales bacterium]